MTSFGSYSKYYDLLYCDKDYASESKFIATLLDLHAPSTERILDLGCGTGRHASLLAEKGYSIHGVDLSPTMLESALARLGALPKEVSSLLSFSQGDARTCSVSGSFDAVIALFHVVSYQITNEDLIDMFNNVARHLVSGGIFIFDFWYGPAVLGERPATRVKRMASDEIEIVRIAEPTINSSGSFVDVNYHLLVRDLSTRVVEETREAHRMRYLFLSDIDFLARQAGFKTIDSREWLTGNEPDWSTWSVCSILMK